MEEPTKEYDEGFLDGLKEGKRRIQAESEPEPTKLTSIWRSDAELYIVPAKRMIGKGALWLVKICEHCLKACDIIDHHKAELKAKEKRDLEILKEVEALNAKLEQFSKGKKFTYVHSKGCAGLSTDSECSCGVRQVEQSSKGKDADNS